MPDSSLPNILLLVIDSARADRMSCYGHDRPTTPNLDALAEQGVVFDNCWSESNWTLPVCFTALTGLHPREHQSETHRQLPAGLPTLQEAMGRAGYTTMLASANQFVGRNCGLDRGFDLYHMPPHVFRMAKPFFIYIGRRMGWTDVGGGSLNTHLLSWLDRADSPWFATVWYNEPHHPFMAKRPFSTRFCPRPLSFWRRQHLMGRMRSMRQLAATADEQEIGDVRGLYDGGVAYSDHLVGQVIEHLQATGRWHNTAIIVTSDHGDMLGEHGLMGHGRAAGMYAPLVRVPLVVRVPGVLDGGDRSNALVQLADVTHTAAALAGRSDDLAPSAAQRVDLREAAAG
ncbi:MAG TPA: sulfatase, partial [Armatimonadota bacterium]|nr:sulfatase [Armatimonadota bacterium]